MSATKPYTRASPAPSRRPRRACTFDQEMLARLAAQGIAQAFVTLHVGAGTFQPVRTQQLSRPHHALGAL